MVMITKTNSLNDKLTETRSPILAAFITVSVFFSNKLLKTNKQTKNSTLKNMQFNLNLLNRPSSASAPLA